jgi:hypothetical protein
MTSDNGKGSPQSARRKGEMLGRRFKCPGMSVSFRRLWGTQLEVGVGVGARGKRKEGRREGVETNGKI